MTCAPRRCPPPALGHLAQNTDVDGTPYWTSIQPDETALPIVLAEQLGAHDAKTRQGVRKAAEFLLSYQGPNGDELGKHLFEVVKLI